MTENKPDLQAGEDPQAAPEASVTSEAVSEPQDNVAERSPSEPAAGPEDATNSEADSAEATGVSGDKLQQELAEAQDQHLRLRAEFENYKRRMHKEQGELLKYAQLPLLRDLTGVMDNLERALGHIRTTENPDHTAFVEGLELVTKQIGEVFERYGMFRIQAKGQPFDPTRHEAMNLVETDDQPENTAVEELQVGYRLYERIVRPAMVSVSKKPGSAGS